MFASQGPSQDPGSLALVVLVVITGAVIFWRTAIKLMAISVILLAILGFLDLLHALQ